MPQERATGLLAGYPGGGLLSGLLQTGRSGLLGLTPEQERRFQYDMQFTSPYRDWYRGFNERFGQTPNLDDSSYDYRRAWIAGAKPEPYEHDQGVHHWPSRTPGGVALKSADHPTAWMETFMQTYGVDPHSAPASALIDGLRRGIVPGWALGK